MKKKKESERINFSNNLEKIISELKQDGLKLKTEKETAEKITKSTLENLERIIAFMPGSVYWKDTNGTYVGCNDAMTKMFNLPKSEILGKSDNHLLEILGISKSEIDVIVKTDNQVMREGVPKLNVEEPAFHCPDGKIINQISNKVPILDEHGNVAGILGISIDITEKKILEEELRESRAREERLKVLSAMGGMIAHELKTPLSGMGLGLLSLQEYISILLKAYKEQNPIFLSQWATIEKICSELSQALAQTENTIDTILVGFKPTHIGNDSLTTVFVDAMVQECLKQYPLTPEERALITLIPHPTLAALGSRKVIQHVLINLLKNALYFIKETGKGLVTIWAEKHADEIHLHFRDTAKGIPKDRLEQIFEPFYTTKAAATSIGMGLYFCRIALEHTGGRIFCDAQEGEYTEFTVILPGIDKIDNS